MSRMFELLVGEAFKLNESAAAEKIAAAERTMGRSLPSEYGEFLRWTNGGEGIIGKTYVMLWRAEELGQYNESYQVEIYAPGLLLFGSDGSGEAYAFDTREPQKFAVMVVPFVGMDLQYAKALAPTFVEFLSMLRAESAPADGSQRHCNSLAGKEIFEIAPVILGGSPTDPANKTVFTRQQHIEAVRYWNKFILGVRNSKLTDD